MDSDKLQRILDYHFQLDDPAQRLETEELLARDSRAQTIDKALKETLAPLDAIADDPAPDGLGQRTLDFVAGHNQARTLAEASRNIAMQPRDSLQEETSSSSTFRWVLGNVRDLVVVAACITLVFMVSRPGFRHARQISQQDRCASQMRTIGSAFNQYAADNNGKLPYVKREPGSKWWHAGQKGKSNSSTNTRNVFLLVKGGYAPVKMFICPSAKIRFHVKKIPAQTLSNLRDFPNRRYVNFSFRLINGDLFPLASSSDVLMADQNPIFADFDCDSQAIIDLSVNSPSHSRRGQNLLFRDGSVTFSRSRLLGPQQDDIFTIKNTKRYRGNEMPLPDDTFMP